MRVRATAVTDTRVTPVRLASIAICADECGAQCCRAPGHFKLTRTELVPLRQAANRLHVRFTVVATAAPDTVVADHALNGGTCAFLDRKTNLCRVYEDRPDACRRFPERYEPRCALYRKPA